MFISLAQSFLLWSITTPTYVLLLASRISTAHPTEGDVPIWGMSDLVASGLIIAMVLVSAVADQQQWHFQNAKKDYQKTAKVPANFEQADLDRGFVTTGLWAYSRHPNFAAEQTVWVAMYQWCCLVTGSLVNWTAIGAVSYLILFQASTWFTELVSTEKYPDYKLYQRKIGKFYPISLVPFSQKIEETPGKTKTPSMNSQPKGKKGPAEEQKRYNLRH
jgi:steroid 5-alpha reductase family enzyme